MVSVFAVGMGGTQKIPYPFYRGYGISGAYERGHRQPQAASVFTKKKDFQKEVLLMAEQEGFEPSVPFWGTHDFQSCPL